MNKKNLENLNFIDRSRILIAPLDWGLGHATRCIPIICELLKKGHKVFIAAEGSQKILLQQEFSDIKYLPLRGYGIRYSRTKSSLPFILLGQIPKVIRAIIYENHWLKKTIKENKIDIVISDNRFGLYSKSIPCVFITHQLLIPSPFLRGLIQRLNYHFINKYHECWIPDFSDAPNLAGILSHPKKMPAIPVRYIGCLSRFQKRIVKEDKHLLVLLSGPEPQRTILEEKIIKQLKDFKKKVLVVRGLPGNETTLRLGDNIKQVNHLPSRQLEDAILSSSFIIARSGYSTVMDLLKLKKKTILIPTPGQGEQEYLAGYLFQQKLAFCVQQESFDDVQKALNAAASFQYSFFDRDVTPILHETLAFKNLLD